MLKLDEAFPLFTQYQPLVKNVSDSRKLHLSIDMKDRVKYHFIDNMI